MFVLLALCLPGAASAQWATSGNNISNTNTGNVGVGTTTPVSKLHTAGIVTAGPVDGDIYRMSGFTNGNLRWAITNSASGVFGVTQRGDNWADEGTRFLIDRDGNVGVGTTAPANPLHVRVVTPGSGVRVEGSSASQASPGYNLFDGARDGGALGLALSPGHWSATAVSGDLVLRSTSGKLLLQAGAGAAAMTVVGGRVGVGNAAPTEALDVVGNIRVDGNINAKYQDVAEWVPTTQKLEAGMVVVLDPERANHVLASTASYDTAVADVISARPGLTLGEAGEGKALVATTGRVKVKVDATRGAIKVGDLLVTSGTPGVAMRSQPLDLGGVPIHRPGTLIGKALESLAGGKGEILVLLSLQ
ncbi:MAG TPA: hypothetical protein VF611_00270 [Pyrinomonadaceae bacterium]|jgi:hypothetical protein